MGDSTEEECALNRKNFIRWIKQIYQTQDAEIDCNQLQELLPTFVDAEISGVILNGEDRGVRLHLSQCPDCHDVYETVRRLATLTENGRLPETAELLAFFDTPPTPQPTRSETAEALAVLRP
jgi:hypothetical protein